MTASLPLARLAILLLALVPAHVRAENVIHTERSLYRNITVTEDGGERCMKFARLYRGNRQSCQSLVEPERLLFDYTRMMLGSLYLAPQPRRILVLGLGGGTLPVALARLLPDSSIDVAEVDPAVVRVAREFFGFRPGPRLQVYEEDGRVFVKRQLRRGARYDLVMLDAFDQDYIPEHLLTREFLQEVKAILAADGVLAANTFSSSRLYAHESVTYEAVFGRFFNLKRGNRVILLKVDGLPDRDTLARNARSVEGSLRRLGVDLDWLLPLFETGRDWSAEARILTDRYSPANLLNGP